MDTVSFRTIILLPRRLKQTLTTVLDAFLLFTAIEVSFLIRLGEIVYPVGNYLWIFFLTPLLGVVIFTFWGIYNTIIRYLGGEGLKHIILANTFLTLSLSLGLFWFKGGLFFPRSVIVIFWAISNLFTCSVRLFVRNCLNSQGLFYELLDSFPSVTKMKKSSIDVVIYGAGKAGYELAGSLKRSKEYSLIGFIDDDFELWGRIFGGVPVFPPSRMALLTEKYGIEHVLLAMPSVSRGRKREIIDFLEKFAVEVKSLPSVSQIARGIVRISDIQDIEIADLLGRDSIIASRALIKKRIEAQGVMVTGAGGSIGSELCRQILKSSPAYLVCFEKSEYALYAIHHELESLIRTHRMEVRLIPILGDVCDLDRVREVISSFKIDTLYHAAAYKHVPMVEKNVVEGVRNNVVGTFTVAKAAMLEKVKDVVLISTDKAVRPTNVMGATKRFSEMILEGLAEQLHVDFGEDGLRNIPNHTRFSMVRFGNVLGSSGSVIPLFRKQIKDGGPLTVTHPEINRYFMTIPEAAELVIQAGALAEGGEVFLLDMGEPVRILELAKRMIKLSGRTIKDDENPDGDIEIVFTGLRPGEKLYEELLIDTEGAEETEHPKIFKASEFHPGWERCRELLLELEEAIQERRPERLREILQVAVSGYSPQCGMVDVLWEAEQRNKKEDRKVVPFPVA